MKSLQNITKSMPYFKLKNGYLQAYNNIEIQVV